MSIFLFENSVIRSQPWLLCLPYQQVESIEWPVSFFGSFFWRLLVLQDVCGPRFDMRISTKHSTKRCHVCLSSAVPSVVPPFWNATVPRCIGDMDPGHSHQNSGLSISHYPCFGPFLFFVSSVSQLCFAMMCLLQMTYDRFLSNRIRNCCCTLIPEWLGGNDSSKMEPWWTMMNHEPWSLEKNFKIQSVCAKSNYENTTFQKISKDVATGIRTSSTKKVME